MKKNGFEGRRNGTFKDKAGFAAKTAAALAIIALTLIGATAQVHAFGFAGYEVGLKGVHKQKESVQQGPDEMIAETVAEEAGSGGPTFAEQTRLGYRQMTANEVREAIRAANNDKYANLFLKSSFSGERFCVSTEQRYMYLGVLDDGTIELLSNEPARCHVLETSEDYLKRVWERYSEGEELTYDDIKENVKIPWAVKRKAFWGKSKNLIGLS
jgi:hypothetical protein